MSLKVLSSQEAAEAVAKRNYPAQEGYLAMYSTWWEGIVKSPSGMMVPVDDHLVHRGDGVFEAIKGVNGQVYLADAHLERLASSAEKISLPLPKSLPEIRQIILETAKVAGERNLLFRLFVSRGPGGFTANPYDSVGSQIYLVVSRLQSPAPIKYQAGVMIGRSAIPAKESWLAQVKTCNYLPNVMMKKESVDRSLDFTVGYDQQGFLTESSTENIVMVDKSGVLVRPKLHQILRGTTMIRSFELAKSLVEKGLITGIEERNIREEEVLFARELMMVGTTLDILPVTSYEGKSVGSGEVGPVARELLNLLKEDMKSGPHTVAW